MVTEQAPRGICPICNKRLVKRQGKTKLGFIYYGKMCDMCYKIKGGRYNKSHHRKRANGTRVDSRRPYLEHKGFKCENSYCTATIVHSSQLEVHHIDKNNKNNDRVNLITLCANCHRLEHLPRDA